MKNAARIIATIAVLIAASFTATTLRAEPVHGIAMHGKPALPANFSHLPYADPDAPKGGIFRKSVVGSFDSLNPFIIKGRAAVDLRTYVFESLLARNRSEPFSLYGLIAEKVDMPDDRTSITFFLNKKARFSDNTPILADDIVFSFETLREKGRPNHRSYYSKVKKVEVIDDHTIKFHLDGADRELPLILGLMPVLSKKFFSKNDFDKTTLKPIIASGPYVIGKVKPGASISYKKNPDYWGKDLPVNKGLWNFDEVRFEYFRDNQSSLEAFKKNLIDIRFESSPSIWTTAYNNLHSGKSELVREIVPHKLPKPTFALVFNTRREVFADRRVRKALIEVFDFEWANANLYHGLFNRTQGYYSRSELSAYGRPAGKLEKQMLADAGASLEPQFIDGSFKNPVSDATGRDRKQLRKAVMQLKAAGWKFKNRVLTNVKTGKPLVFEIIVQTRNQEKIALHYQRSLRQIGVKMSIRQIDSAQFQKRRQTYDYDMIPNTWYNSLSPGNEQNFYWGSNGRTQEGTRNYMGVADPAIDKMISKLVAAKTREQLVAAARNIDRLLTSGYYVVPLYNASGQWMARWSHIKYPKTISSFGFQPQTAWYEKP